MFDFYHLNQAQTLPRPESHLSYQAQANLKLSYRPRPV
jgi:hypothetical protein